MFLVDLHVKDIRTSVYVLLWGDVLYY